MSLPERTCLYHSWYKQVPTHCLLLRATTQGTCLTQLKCPAIISTKLSSLIMFTSKFTNDSFLRVQKNPGNLAVPGYLTFGHTISYDTKFIYYDLPISDYSMIVATRPDPTVRPPSRYFNPVLSHIFYGFLSKIQWKTAELHHLFWFAWFLGTVLAPENTQTDSLL